MKRSIGFSKNLNSLDNTLPAINMNRAAFDLQSQVNTKEEDDSDSDFISEIMRPKNFQKHKGFVSYYSTGSSSSSKSNGGHSPYLMKRVSIDTPLQLPDLQPYDFMTTGCEKFDRILSLKEDANKKRCITPTLLGDTLVYQDQLSVSFPPKLPQLTINLSKVNFIDAEGKVTEVRNSPISVAVVDEIEEEFNRESREDIGAEILSLCTLIPLPPTVLPKAPNTPSASARNGRSLMCVRRAAVVN